MWRLTDEQRAFRDHVRDIVLAEVRPRVVELDDRSDYPQDLHDVLARERLLGLSIPKEYGGGGMPAVSACAFVEELGKVSGTMSLIGAYVDLAALPILLGRAIGTQPAHLGIVG